MQTETLTYDVKQQRWSAPFPALDSSRTLVLAFGDPAIANAPGPLKALKHAFPSSVVAGCSGSGEIVGTTVKDDVLAVSVTKFEKTFVSAVSAPCPDASQSFTVGEALAKKLNKPMLRAVFVLSDGLKVNGSELVKGLNSALDESVVVTGGLAGDGARFEKTWVSLNENVGPGVVVAIGLYGDFLRISHGSKGGWDKFGPERVVTKSEGNVLYELDGKPALAIYKEYLGEKASGLPGTGLLFPLSLRANSKDDKALVRTILAVDEAKQSMTFAGDVPAGFLAQLMKADFDRLIGGAATAATAARKLVSLDDPNTLAVAVSCVGRRLVLGERTEEEVEAVMDVLPKGAKVTGFYSYGELSPYASGRCDLHNQTMTLTTFSESATPVVRSAARTAPVAPPVPPPISPAVRASSDSGLRAVPRASSDSGVRSAAPAVPAGMRVETLTYDVKQAKWSAPFPALDSPKTLVLAFGDPAIIDAPAPLKALRQAFPNSVVAGCSGSGEIVGTTVKDDVLTVAIAKFEKTWVAAVSAPCGDSRQSFTVGEALAKKLNKPSLRAVFVLSDGLKVNGSELVKGLNSALDESVVVTGGLAGDGARFEKTWVSLNENVGPGVVVAVGLYGDFLRISHGSKGGWDKFGPERVVTKSEGNVLYELDGKPALAIYKEYLGEKASGLPGTGLLFPLSLRANSKDDKALVRTILAVDEAKQSMTFAGDVPAGFLAQLMKADFERLIGGAATAATTAKKLVSLEDPNTLAVAVSCVGRRLVLGERTEEEVEAVMDVLPKGAKVTGFYSYGELSPYASGRCDLHNQTMTLTTFSESATPVVRTAVKSVTTPAAPVQAVAPAPAARSTVGLFEEIEVDTDSATRQQPAIGMRVETLTYDVKQAKWSAPFPALDSPKTLVLAFGDPAIIDAPAPLKALRQAFPSSVVAGCSGSGEIVGTTVKDDVLTVAITKFEKTSVAAVSLPCTQAAQSFTVGEALAKKLNKPSLRAVFVLSDGLKVNGSELVKGLNSALDESVVVTGGLAGDGARFEKTWVSLNENVGPGVVVAVGLYGDFLRISHGSKGGWDKFGPERVVTKSEGNVLYELDGKPALAIYKEYLGEKASGLPGTGLLFPLSLRANSKDDKALVRTILAVDEAKQSMTFAGDVPAGFLAQLMKADFERLIGGAATAATTAKKLVSLEDPNTLAVAVSCVGRRLVLGERTEEEVEAVMDVLPKGAKVTGFYSYGELSPYASGRCDLHNQTMTLTTFSESATPIARPTPKPAPVSAPRPSMAPPAPQPSVPPPAPRPSMAPAPVPSAPRQAPRLIERRVTRLVGSDRSASPNAIVEIDRSTAVTVVRVKGKLSEAFQGRDISSLSTTKVLFDLADVERITSFGVREWLQMLGDLEPKGVQLYLARCSEAVVNQLGMIRRFAGGGKVLSFFAPYLCGGCGAQFSTLIDCEVDAAAIASGALPEADCPSCGKTGHFDDDARSYLAFHPEAHRPPADVLEVLESLPPVGVADPIEKFIDGRVNRVRVNSRLDESVRWRRVFEGLEGEVVLELGSAAGTTPEGLKLLATGLGGLPAEVEAFRLEGAPVGLLSLLSERDPRLSITTALVDGFCATCNARRPTQLRVEEAKDSLAQGKAPFVVCKRCNSRITFEGLHAVLGAVTVAKPPPPHVPDATVVAAREPLAAPTASPAPPSRSLSPVAIVAAAVGLVVVVLLSVLVGRFSGSPAPVAPVTPTVAPVVTPVVTQPAPVPAAPEQALPPAWSEVPFSEQGEDCFVVGRARGTTEEQALAAARTDALVTLVKQLQARLAGTRVHEYLLANPVDVSGNAEPVVARLERQVGPLLAVQRTDAALSKKEGAVTGPVRYRLSRSALDEAVKFYAATGTAVGVTVARFFPTLEASLRTDAELLVISAGRGLAWRAGLRDGDPLLTVDGRPTVTVDAFSRLMRDATVPGATIALGVESAGTRRTVRVTLPRPPPDNR